jgi:hypothetical protein
MADRYLNTLTELEAIKAACCQCQTPGDFGPGGVTCGTDACTAWRWVDEAFEVTNTFWRKDADIAAHFDTLANQVDEPEGWKADSDPKRVSNGSIVVWRRPVPFERRGYCGRAGYPNPTIAAEHGGKS